MRTSKQRTFAAALALALLAIATDAPRLAYAEGSSTPPVSQCSDFGCES